MTPQPDRQHYNVTLAILAIGALAFALAQTTLLPALPAIQHHYGATASEAALVITSYFLVAAVATPILGRLGDMFGKQRLLAVSLAAFAAGALVCALAGSLEVTVAGRALMGVGGGVFPLSFGIIRDEFPRERVSTGIGLLGSITGVGGGIGLPLGGIIVDHASFHWIFWLWIALALIATATTLLFVPESPIRSPGRVDVLGAVVLTIGLVLPLVGLSRANVWGWGSPKLRGLCGAGLAVLVGFGFLERHRRDPLVDLATLRRRAVLTTNIATLLVGFGLFGSFVLIPLLAQTPESTGYGFGLDATQAGLLLLPCSLLNLLGAPLAGAVGARVGSKLPLLVGTTLSAVALLGLSFAHGTPAIVTGWACFLGFGFGLAYAAMPNLIIEAVDAHETGEATGVNTILRNIGATLGSQVAATVLAGHVIASTGFPSDEGFELALLVGAAGSVLAALSSLAIPGRARAAVPAARPPARAPARASEPYG